MRERERERRKSELKGSVLNSLIDEQGTGGEEVVHKSHCSSVHLKCA